MHPAFLWSQQYCGKLAYHVGYPASYAIISADRGGVHSILLSSYTDAASFIKEADSRAQVMALEHNVKEFGVRYWGLDDDRQGIVHVIGYVSALC